MNTLVYGYKTDAKISNLYSFLRKTKADKLVVRTSHISKGWDDVQFDASAAGFKVSIAEHKDWKKAKEFAEVYHFVRK